MFDMINYYLIVKSAKKKKNNKNCDIAEKRRVYKKVSLPLCLSALKTSCASAQMVPGLDC